MRRKTLERTGFACPLRSKQGTHEIGDFMGSNWRDNLNYVRSMGYRDE
nr:MAG TPA: hypothetical protein [Caudoviricetes sp.]